MKKKTLLFFQRLKRKIQFTIERLFLEGSLYQIIGAVLTILIISVIGGVLAFNISPELFETIWHAIWWAFLRLTDSGYLGDDKGIGLITVSTIITIMGYVLFLGTLIAMMTQWMYRIITNLETGRGPISIRDHILILGSSEDIYEMVKEIQYSEGRVERFLKRIGANNLKIVILTKNSNVEMIHEFKTRFGKKYSSGKIIVRNGDIDDIDHLNRVDFKRASTIIIPSAKDSVNPTDSDANVFQVLKLLEREFKNNKHKPVIIPEVYSETLKHLMGKSNLSSKLEYIFGIKTVSRIIFQCINNSGLSVVYHDLLSHDQGNEFYIKEFPDLEKKLIDDIKNNFKESICVGVITKKKNQEWNFILPFNHKLKKNDKLVFIAENYDSIKYMSPIEKPLIENNNEQKFEMRQRPAKKRILIIGWNNYAPLILKEYSSFKNFDFELTIVSSVSLEKRKKDCQFFETALTHEWLIHKIADTQYEKFFKKEGLENFDKICLLSYPETINSDQLNHYMYHQIKNYLLEHNKYTDITVELKDPNSKRLFEKEYCDTLISPLILGHIMVHVALRRELNDVLEVLLGPKGPELTMRQVTDFGLNLEKPVTFDYLKNHLEKNGVILIGVRQSLSDETNEKEITINPPPDSIWQLDDRDRFITIVNPHFEN